MKGGQSGERQAEGGLQEERSTMGSFTWIVVLPLFIDTPTVGVVAGGIQVGVFEMGVVFGVVLVVAGSFRNSMDMAGD